MKLKNKLFITIIMNYKLTFGIPTCNRLIPLLQLIESIRKQTFKDFFVLISDDGTMYDLNRIISEIFSSALLFSKDSFTQWFKCSVITCFWAFFKSAMEAWIWLEMSIQYLWSSIILITDSIWPFVIFSVLCFSVLFSLFFIL